MADKIKRELKAGHTVGLIHDSRTDVKNIARFCNEMANKINELIDEIEELKKRLADASNG